MKFFLFILGMSLSFSRAFASDFSLGAGPMYAFPMGDSHQTLSPGPGGLIQLWSPFPFWRQPWVQLQSSAFYQRFSIRNHPEVSLNRIGVHLGPKFHAALGIARIFFSVQLGALVDSLFFSAGSSVGVNELGFTAQVVPGVDFAFSERVGLVGEIPTTVLFQSGYLVWTPSLSFRINL